MTTLRILAPAKINLGIEIIRKRPDGFHEIRSILAMIDLADVLTATTIARDNPVRVTGTDVAERDNLINRALSAVGIETGIEVDVEKRIPVAAGLGGASSDAAATLLVGNALLPAPIGHDQLGRIAISLGSDVPFFLGTPCAAVSGTGADLRSIPPPRGHIVLVTPPAAIPNKTATLYGSLNAGDFSDGSEIDAQRRRLVTERGLDPGLLANAFARPLEALVPGIIKLRERMLQCGAPFVALSGAGPTHYTIVDSDAEAVDIESRLRERLVQDVAIHRAVFRTQPLTVEVVSTGNP